MFTVQITEQRVTGGKPNTYRETITAKDENHLEKIRQAARKSATVGGTQKIKVTRI